MNKPQQRIKQTLAEAKALCERVRIRLMTQCECGSMANVVQDQEDAMKFHVECHGCGAAYELTRENPNG